MGFPGGARGKELDCQCRRFKIFGFGPSREDPLEEGMATHSSILAWRIHGQRSLAGYCPWDCKELGTNELTLEVT